MNIEVNGLMMGSGTPYILKEVDGLDSADIRTSQFNYSGRDGGDITEQFLGLRPISIVGAIDSETCELQRTQRLALAAATPIRNNLTVRIITYTGHAYRAVGRLVAFDNPMGMPMLSDFKLELLCPDPLLYDDTVVLSTTVNKKASGGYSTPYEMPVLWAAASGAVNVANNGAVIIYPTVVLTGSAQNPIITNTRNGQFIQLNLTMVSGDVVRIDMANRTITLNGGSILGLKTATSQFWGLELGANAIELNSGVGTDTVSAVITWQNGFTGI